MIRRVGRRPGASLLALILMLAACQPKAPPLTPSPPAGPPSLALTPSTFTELSGWRDDRVAEALPALVRSCARLLRAPADKPVGVNGVGGAAGDWRPACAALQGVVSGSDGALRAWAETWLQPIAVAAGGEAEGLFTGYYEPELAGSRRRSDPYRVPLYQRPPDLIAADLGAFADDLAGRTVYGRVKDGRFIPYLTRAEIDQGALAGRGLELIWLDDPVDTFLLQVQGSGLIRLAEGGETRVGFAASNGLPFTGISRELIDRGAVSKDDASMQAVRAWLKAHPTEATSVMHKNRRYIFFREIAGEGPIGAEGVPLTPGRSLAVDTALLPLGAPVWLDTVWPSDPAQPLRRLMVAQDAGAAIRGAVRGDFFWGTGEAALAEAGRMKSRGRYWLLLPKPLAARIAAGS